MDINRRHCDRAGDIPSCFLFRISRHEARQKVVNMETLIELIRTHYLVFLFIMSAGAFKAISDSIQHTEKEVRRPWWQKNGALKYRHRKIIVPKPEGGYYKRAEPIGPPMSHWWYLGLIKTAYMERFPFSSTALVFLTDAWHFFNWMQYRCFHLAIVASIGVESIKQWIVILALMAVCQGVVFQIIYKRRRKRF